MTQTFNFRRVTSNANETGAIELSAALLDRISAGGTTRAHEDEAPKETVTFEYGGLAINYGH